MATFYSDHYSADGSSKTTRLRGQFPPRGARNGIVYSAIGYAVALATTSDFIRMFSLPSSCKLLELWASANDEAAAGAFHVGLYETEENGGAVIDADLFSSALAKNAARVDALIEATTITKMMRGRFELWQMADAGDGTYTQDPTRLWDVCITPSTTFTTTPNSFLLEAKYTLGS